MNRIAAVGGIAIGLLMILDAAAESTDEHQTKIPLDQVWGYNFSGTRDIRELEPKRDVSNMAREEFVWGSLVNRIGSRLNKGPKVGDHAEPAFAVVGTGREALKNADPVFLGRKKASEVLPKDTELTLVFFVHLIGLDARIDSVDVSPGEVKVKYQFISKGPMQGGTTRFALIPIGKFPPGKVHVAIEQLPTVDEKGQPTKQVQNHERYVSNSSFFTVE